MAREASAHQKVNSSATNSEVMEQIQGCLTDINKVVKSGDLSLAASMAVTGKNGFLSLQRRFENLASRLFPGVPNHGIVRTPDASYIRIGVVANEKPQWSLITEETDRHIIGSTVSISSTALADIVDAVPKGKTKYEQATQKSFVS